MATRNNQKKQGAANTAPVKETENKVSNNAAEPTAPATDVIVVGENEGDIETDVIITGGAGAGNGADDEGAGNPIINDPMPEVSKETNVSTNKTIYVYCKLPHGVQFRLPNGSIVALAGSGHKLRGLDKGVLPVGAYGMTAVNQEDWEYISKQHANLKAFKLGHIFAEVTKTEGLAKAKDLKEVKTGLEPVDLKKNNQRGVNSKQVKIDTEG